MFKKFKDKLAEEVKSSPQRLQQFAQAAQAAVTSASSSVSDITNNDLFSIGDSDSASKSQTSTTSQQSTFRDTSPIYQESIQSHSDIAENTMTHEDTQRQRRLSNSSFASDISFRLPSYESPSMYHLQSDMEISASEAEEKGFIGGNVNLDRVTKEQLYTAYRRTRDRCSKYKTQYADLARHYKLLERENAKAKNVLVETQDKALRRISELREQCSLEQNAKAHLERALRIDIDEKNMKIHALNTKLNLLQNNPESSNDNYVNNTSQTEKESDMQLINLNDNEQKETSEETLSSEIVILNNKLEKMEQLITKYKESLKVAKEKNAQMMTEIQILSGDLQTKSKENEQLKEVSVSLTNSNKKIQELNDVIEDLQNKCNTYEFTKNKTTSILEINLQSAQEEILQLQSKIEDLKKKEEEYAISLAENKLSIHKELEGKEAEIKSLKDALTEAQNEIKSLHITISDYKNNIAILEAERITLNNDISDLNITKGKIKELESQLDELKQKCQSLEHSKAKLDEVYKCLQLQMKQETAEKLAMIDRNSYLENRNTQLSEENVKKSSQIHDLESELQSLGNNTQEEKEQVDVNALEEISKWKTKCENLEREMQDERDELIKLQSEIEKLIRNHELIQAKNLELDLLNSNLQKEITALQEHIENNKKVKNMCGLLQNKVKDLRKVITIISEDTRSLNLNNTKVFSTVQHEMLVLNNLLKQETDKNNEIKMNFDLSEKELRNISSKYESVVKDLKLLKNENKNLIIEIDKYKSEIVNTQEELHSVRVQNEVYLNESAVLRNEIESLNNRIDNENVENSNAVLKFKSVETEKHNLVTEKQDLETEKQNLETEKQNLLEKLKDAHGSIELLNKELLEQKKQCIQMTEEIKILSHNNSNLINEKEEKMEHITKLEQDIGSLRQENLTLKNLSETISTSVNKLESEMNEVRKSHAEIEKEKDHLNSIIEQLEKNQLQYENSNIGIDKDSQTDINLEKEFDIKIISLEETQIIDNKIANESRHSNTSNKQNCNNNTRDVSDVEDKYNTLLTEYDSLKEENRRLQSDVEGLQVYLAKISKENSQLNDKLREYFASGENLPEKNEALYQEIEQLKSEIQSGKEKIDNLIRENNILVEENLELKDQLQSQSYDNYAENKTVQSNNNTEQELLSVKEKYSNLQDEKKKLQIRLEDVEQMTQSVNEHMHQTQLNNERLRLCNEKLERRLDEALVSLRHLHSLQENTELEYLRNILYEYLTGSGTHSLTLAKVLAAVVKFTDTQTEFVLQKERERQGFLRQLGLL